MARTTRSMGAAEIQHLPDTMQTSDERPDEQSSRKIKTATGAKKATSKPKAAPKPVDLGPAPEYPVRPQIMYDSESEEWQTYKKGMDAYHDYGRALRDAERLQAKKKRAKRKAEEDIIKAADVYDSQDEVTQKPMKRGRRRRWLDMIEAREQKLEAAKDKTDYYRPDDPCFLFRVPREIRDIIYGFVFPTTAVYHPLAVTNDYVRYHNLWKLPGIFTACKITFEESRVVWAKNSTVNLRLSEGKLMTVLERIGNNSRGLRANKDTDSSLNFLKSMLDFGNMKIKVESVYLRRRVSPQPFETLLKYLSEFLPVNKPLTLDLTDMSYCYRGEPVQDWLKSLDEFVPKIPQLKLTSRHFESQETPTYPWYSDHSNHTAAMALMRKNKDRVLKTLAQIS